MAMMLKAGESAREHAKAWIGGLDFVSREEFEAVKAMAAAARDEADAPKGLDDIVAERMNTLERMLAVS